MSDIGHQQNISSSDINLIELANILLQGKSIIIFMTIFLSVASVLYSISLPNIYQSKALLASVNTSSGAAGALKGYSGLASLTGISIPSDSSEGNSLKALEKIKSLSFFEDNVLPNIFLPDLMAIKSGNLFTKSLAYDEDIYDLKTKTWIDDSNNIKNNIPSAQESFTAFQKHLSISEDTNTGFINIAIQHQSPQIAKQWTELLIDEINNFYRLRDKSEAERKVSYLNEQIAMTNLSEIKQVIAELLQQETQKLTLIEANQFYVFEYIDPPAIMEKKIAPKRSQICIMGAILGFIFGILVVIVRNYLNKKEVS